LKFFRQNNYTERANILYFLNLVYFLSLVGLWQNHVIYLPLTGLMSRYTTPFTKRVVNKYGSVCPCYRSFFYGTLHMWARIDKEHNYKEKMFIFQTWKKDLLSHGDIAVKYLKLFLISETFILLALYNMSQHYMSISLISWCGSMEPIRF
jgi:hypothetical protein